MANPAKRSKLTLSGDSNKSEKVHQFLDQFVLSDDTIKRVMTDFESQMKLAYSKDESTRKSSSVLNENTYIHHLLEGNESGNFLGLDLGGSNFRIVRATIQNSKLEMTMRSYRLPDELMDKRAEKIFDHMAEKIAVFLEEENAKEQTFHLGFTFSFPMKQSSLRSGCLVTWTKNFRCPNGPGEDVVVFLEEAIKRRGDLNVVVVALLCDTTATLIAGNGDDPNCRIGLIIGTGCNASFVERVENAAKVDQTKQKSKQVVIDVQWGALGDNGCVDYIKTELDKQLDQESKHPGVFAYEKLLSGLYLGEIVRLILVHFTREGLIFGGQGSDQLYQRETFTTQAVSNVERDEGTDSINTRTVLCEMGLEAVASDDDIAIVREACAVVSARAAHLVATNLSVLLQHIKQPEVTIAADGSVYEQHPNIHNLMLEKMAQLVPQTKVKIQLCKEGSGKGAALVAAIAQKQAAAATSK